MNPYKLGTGAGRGGGDVDAAGGGVRAAQPSPARLQDRARPPPGLPRRPQLLGMEREFFVDSLLVRIHFIIEMIVWTGLAPWESPTPRYGRNVLHSQRERSFWTTYWLSKLEA